MKKEIMVEQSFCDFCEKKASGYSKCINCGKDFCYECSKVKAIEYKCGVNHSGSGDALYCIECNKKLFTNGDRLHEADRKVLALRNESKGYYADFKKRQEEAEEAVQREIQLQKKKRTKFQKERSLI